MGTAEHRYGIHYYQDLLGCIKRAFIDDAGEDAEYGTTFHAFAEWYHGQGAGESPALDTRQPVDRSGRAKGCSEAELAARYASRFPANIWGKFLLREERLKGTIAGEPAEGTVDGIIELDEDASRRLASVRNIYVEPGRYLFDFKTKGSRQATLIESLENSSQFALYHELWRQRGGEPLKGTIAQVIFRYKDDKDDAFLTLLLPPPSADNLLTVRTIVREGAARLRALGPEHVTPTHCYDWSRPCPLLGVCARHNETEV